MGAHLILGLVLVMQTAQTTLPAVTASVPPKVPIMTDLKPAARCDARPYQRLVGRTVSDLLTARVPPNTRIYRIDDPVTEVIQAGRLSVELNRSTRVRRVYCS